MKKDHLFWIYPVIYLGLLVIAINWDKSDMVTSAAENDDSKLYATETTDMQNRISGNLGSGNQDYYFFRTQPVAREHSGETCPIGV